MPQAASMSICSRPASSTRPRSPARPCSTRQRHRFGFDHRRADNRIEGEEERRDHARRRRGGVIFVIRRQQQRQSCESIRPAAALRACLSGANQVQAWVGDEQHTRRKRLPPRRAGAITGIGVAAGSGVCLRVECIWPAGPSKACWGPDPGRTMRKCVPAEDHWKPATICVRCFSYATSVSFAITKSAKRIRRPTYNTSADCGSITCDFCLRGSWKMIWWQLGEVAGKRTLKKASFDYDDACSAVVKRCEVLCRN